MELEKLLQQLPTDNAAAFELTMQHLIRAYREQEKVRVLQVNI